MRELYATQSGPSGEDPMGSFDFSGGDTPVFGVPVACMDATANTATVAGVVPGGALGGTVVAITVVDNTTPGGTETVTALEAVTGPAEQACRTPVPSAPATVVDDPTACKAERVRIGPSAFAKKYGTNRNRQNAFGKCVSAKDR